MKDCSNKYCVYIHTNKINGKKYVGQTGTDVNERWRKDGCGYLRKKDGKYVQPLFAHAIIKYGWDNFEHEIAFSNLTLDEANNLEKVLISEFDTTNPKKGYNIRSGGENSIFNEESRQRRSEAHKGIKHSEGTKRKLSELHKGKIAYTKKIMQLDYNGMLIKIWDSMKEASEQLKIGYKSISNCCRGKSKSAGGYHWRYA